MRLEPIHRGAFGVISMERYLFSCEGLVFDSLASNMCKVGNPSNVHQSHELKVAFLWMFFSRIDITQWRAMSLEQTNLLPIYNFLHWRKPFRHCNDKKARILSCDSALLRMGIRLLRTKGWFCMFLYHKDVE